MDVNCKGDEYGGITKSICLKWVQCDNLFYGKSLAGLGFSKWRALGG